MNYFRSVSLPLVAFVLFATGCIAPATPVEVDAADAAPSDSVIGADDADALLTDAPADAAVLCQQPLSAMPANVPTTVASAKLAAQAGCGSSPKSAVSVACPDGGIVVSVATGFSSQTWWFAADGTLIGFGNMIDVSNDGCFFRMYGQTGTCTNAPSSDPASTGLCPPVDTTDSNDTSPDATALCVDSTPVFPATDVSPAGCDPAKLAAILANNAWVDPPGGMSSAPPPVSCSTCEPLIDDHCASACDCKAVWEMGFTVAICGLKYLPANVSVPWLEWEQRVPGATGACVVPLSTCAGGFSPSFTTVASGLDCVKGHCVIVPIGGP